MLKFIKDCRYNMYRLRGIYSMLAAVMLTVGVMLMQYAPVFRVLLNQRGDVVVPGTDPNPGMSPDTMTAALESLKGKKLTISDLGNIIQLAVKEASAKEVKELRDQIATVNRRAIFPDGNLDPDTNMGQSWGKSIIDTNFFNKHYRTAKVFSGRGRAVDDGLVMGSQLIGLGGPFKRLSPELEEFAKMIKLKMHSGSMASAGIDVKSYNDRVREQYKAATGLSEGVAADGGVLVPIEFLATVIEFAVAQSPILSKVWRLQMSSNLMRIPRLVQAAGAYFGGIALHWISEAAQKVSTKPAFEQLEFTPAKLIGLIFLTDELIADSMINIVNYITGLFTRAFQYEMERVILNGSGVGQPLGIVNDPAINLVGRTTAGTVVYDDLVNLDSALDENFRDLEWITRKATMGTIRKLKDLQNQPIFHADYATYMGQRIVPPTALGYPINLTRNCPSLGNQGDLVLGDLGMYILAMRQEMTIDQSIHVRFEYDETCLRFVSRLDGKPGVSIAFAVLNDATS
jgi:HK97 family phage major capsid protein